MKKIFLSLSAIALLAVGTVSCGGDDSSTPQVVNPDDTTPDDTVPGESNGILTFGGTNYSLDTTIYGVVGNSTDGPTGYNIDTDGDGTGDTICTMWIIGSYDGDSYSSSDNGADYYIYVPVNGDSLVYPEESETIYLATSDVWVDGVSVVDASTISAFNMELNVVDTEGEVIDYNASVTFASGTASVDFNGTLDGIYYFTMNSSKGTKAKASIKGKLNKEVKVNNISKEVVSLK